MANPITCLVHKMCAVVHPLGALNFNSSTAALNSIFLNLPVPFEGLEGVAKNFRLKSTILPTRKLMPIEQKL